MKMKFTSLAILIATALTASEAVPTTAGSQASSTGVAEGLWIETIDAAGNSKVSFTPHQEIVNSTSFEAGNDVQERASVEKRREGCHASARISSSITDAANLLLLSQYAGTQVRIDGRARASYVYQNARSFICAYSPGWKPKSAILATWDWVKRVKCGVDRLGHGQVQEGSGDWTAGYTFDTDRFCW
ncbi:hypothetical protein N657DRAFT_675421 [Parathielavia appendiculata]|uniref:Uncharacterized protein n=1 Tax=Parathielavia appendiculata TaxID=2587402 RepID=A0AAN6TQ74_9PEZI|nr:hypothetical protein N657DRAFT_675421 [Parathielavia appendiculata]